MKVRCPNCQTLYRIDPAPAPLGDKTARCGRCDEVFRLASHLVIPAATSPMPPSPSARPEVRSEEPTAEVGDASWEGLSGAASTPAVPPSTEGAAPTLAAARESVPADAPPPPATGGATANASTSTCASAFRFFGPQDPHQRARHLARALVSDIVAYYPDRLERSRAAGTLREEFREEVLKSWEEFVLQVGAEFARETDHFQTALNDILARGEQVF